MSYSIRGNEVVFRNINSSKTKDAKIPIQKSPTNDRAIKYLPVKPKEKADNHKASTIITLNNLPI